MEYVAQATMSGSRTPSGSVAATQDTCPVLGSLGSSSQAGSYPGSTVPGGRGADVIDGVLGWLADLVEGWLRQFDDRVEVLVGRSAEIAIATDRLADFLESMSGRRITAVGGCRRRLAELLGVSPGRFADHLGRQTRTRPDGVGLGVSPSGLGRHGREGHQACGRV
jgi:hypothetical protein